jgi:hypothetical protein
LKGKNRSGQDDGSGFHIVPLLLGGSMIAAADEAPARHVFRIIFPKNKRISVTSAMRQLAAISFACCDFAKTATGSPIKITGTMSQKNVTNNPANVRAKQVTFRMTPKAFDAMRLCISRRLL